MKAIVLLLCAVLLTACSMDSTLRSDKLLTREEAKTTLQQSLPDSASDICYLIYAGGLQDLEKSLQFHVDAAKADQAIEEMIAENNRTMKRYLLYARSSLPPPQPAMSHIDPVKPARFKPISWWQPRSIQNGYFRGENESLALTSGMTLTSQLSMYIKTTKQRILYAPATGAALPLVL